MKKILFIALTALFAITACNKIETPEESHLALNVTVNYVDDSETKATKHGWETGDRILLLFNKVVDGTYKRAEMTYNSSTGWSFWWSSGAEEAIKATSSGTVSAIYVPYTGFNNIGLDEGNYSLGFTDNSPGGGVDMEEFLANYRIFSYYMADEGESYSVSDNTLNLSLKMKVPDRETFIHFFLPEEPIFGPLVFRRFVLENVYLSSLSVTGYNKTSDMFTTTEVSDKKIYSYLYQGGYSFTAIVKNDVILGLPFDYNFTLTDNQTSKTYSLHVSEKTLTRGKAIKLPPLSQWTDTTPTP